jgi:hypothetical protein
MDTRLYALNPDGTLKWRRTISVSSMNVSPALPLGEGSIYVSDAGSQIASFNTGGSTNWIHSYDDGGGSTAGHISVAPDGTIYLTDKWNQQLVALTPAGTEKWRYTLAQNPNCTPAIGPDGTVYICADGLYAVDAIGGFKWKSGNPLFSEASPVISADGLIFWRDGFKLYATTATGIQKWAATIPAGATGSTPSPALGADGTLYSPQPDTFATNNQRLVAYYTKPLQLTDVRPIGNDVSVSWSAVGGETYRVQSAPSVPSSGNPNFTDVSPNVSIGGTNQVIASFVDIGARTNASSRFYRVRRVP